MLELALHAEWDLHTILMNVPCRRSGTVICLLAPTANISRRRSRAIRRFRGTRPSSKCRTERPRSRWQCRGISHRARTAQPSASARTKSSVVTSSGRAHPASTLRPDRASELVRIQAIRYPAEGTQTLQDLRWILGFVQVDGEEAVVRWHVEGRRFAGAQEVRDVLHLHEGHGRAFKLDRCAWEA